MKRHRIRIPMTIEVMTEELSQIHSQVIILRNEKVELIKQLKVPSLSREVSRLKEAKCALQERIDYIVKTKENKINEKIDIKSRQLIEMDKSYHIKKCEYSDIIHILDQDKKSKEESILKQKKYLSDCVLNLENKRNALMSESTSLSNQILIQEAKLNEIEIIADNTIEQANQLLKNAQESQIQVSKLEETLNAKYQELKSSQVAHTTSQIQLKDRQKDLANNTSKLQEQIKENTKTLNEFHEYYLLMEKEHQANRSNLSKQEEILLRNQKDLDINWKEYRRVKRAFDIRQAQLDA